MITLRRGGRCAGCGAALDVGTRAWWDGERRSTTCSTCAPGGGPLWPILPAPPPVTDRDRGTAGASAQQEYDRRRARREERVRAAHPHLGGLVLAFSDEPATTTAWAAGAEGERRVGACLDGLAGRGVVVLHDRRVPRSRANLDHVAVGPSGVFVVDAKRYCGRVARRDVGGWFRRDVRLYVGRRDCSKLVASSVRQAVAVRERLAGCQAAEGVPVVAVLCFVDAEWALFAKPFTLDAVHVAWPDATADLVARPGPLPPERVDAVAAAVAAAFPPWARRR